MKTLLVTGGAGFIGSQLIHTLINKTDFNIVNLDLLTYAADISRLDSLHNHPRYSFVQGDIRDAGLLGGIFEKYSIGGVIHCAAESHVDRGFADPRLFFDVNVMGTQSLLDAAAKHWADKSGGFLPTARFLHVSTDEVYGDTKDGSLFDEQSSLCPNHPYAASKAASDLLALSYYNTYSFPVVITRGTNTFGPGQHPEKLVPSIITSLLAGQPPHIHGSGRQLRDWIFVEDHCDALLQVFCRGEIGEVYNIAVNEEHSVLEMVELIQAELACATQQPVFVEDRPIQDKRFLLSKIKLRSKLKWKPRHGFLEALRKTVEWYTDPKHTIGL